MSGFACITAMISDLHLFYGMAGMRIISRLEKDLVLLIEAVDMGATYVGEFDKPYE